MAIYDINRIGAAGNFDYRGIIKTPGKFFRINGGGRNNQFQIFSPAKQEFKYSQEKVDIKTSFMRFIDNNRIIGAK